MQNARRKILISNSGGETSAFMTRWLLEHSANEFGLDAEFIVVFANTGKEREETLEFVRECDRVFGFNTIWVEAVVDPRYRVGTKHRIVTFETANRDGKPFEDVISKYGIPNRDTPHCTRELKSRPIKSYAASIGWADCEIAIGIRADEADRINEKRKELNLIYPLISMRETTKPEILQWWAKQPFRLRLQSYQGNCDFCWKKTNRKLLTLAKENPGRLKWWDEQEKRFGGFAQPSQKAMARLIADGEKRTFFRGRRSAVDLLALAEQPFVPWDDGAPPDFQPGLDFTNGCSESCEVF